MRAADAFKAMTGRVAGGGDDAAVCRDPYRVSNIL
jgi:hypothetical protein